MQRPICSIIIVTYNTLEILKECLEGLSGLSNDKYEIFVVDNGSTDGTSYYIRIKFPWVKLIGLKRNVGYAGGCNVGAKYAKGMYLLFMNSDVLITPQSIEEMINFIKNKSRIGIVCPKVLQYHSGGSTLDNAGGEITYPFGFAPRRGCGQEDSPNFNKVRIIAYAPGSVFLVRKDLFHKVGGFDEAYFCYHEEVDLCWRIRLAGYLTVFYPCSVAYHRGSYTAKKFSINNMYLMRRNRLITNLKNYDIFNLTIWLVLEFAKAGLLGTVGSLLSSGRRYNLSYFRGLLWVFKNLKRILHQRRIVQHLRRVSDKQALIYHSRRILP